MGILIVNGQLQLIFHIWIVYANEKKMWILTDVWLNPIEEIDYKIPSFNLKIFNCYIKLFMTQ